VAVMAYDVTLEIDGVTSVVSLDDTYPAVNEWVTATEFAIHMAMHDHPDANIEFIDCAEYVHEEYTQYGYIQDAPLTLQ
tara:strand:- start:488 stop:724 length:237 start_codon:yes stop_codon:yes gene_type:complete